MSEIEKIDLGLDSTGRGGDSQRTAFEKCNDNFSALVKDVEKCNDNFSILIKDVDNTINTAIKKAEVDFAKKGENSDITELKGLTQNVIQPSDARDNMGSVTLRQLNAAVANASTGSGGVTRIMSDFLGAIHWFNGSRASIPKGFVAADGQLLKRDDYPEIWTLISTNMLNVVSDKEWLGSRSKRASFSTGNDSTTFRIPDINGVQSGSYKGLFIRGDGFSPSGTVLGDAIREITGKIAAAGAVAWQNDTGVFNLYGPRAKYPSQHSDGTLLPTQLEFKASRVVPTASENRPVSANYIAIIRIEGVIRIDTQQEVVKASDKALNPNDIVSGGISESVYYSKSTKYISSDIKSIKTVGVAGTGIQFNTSDYSTNPPTTRQYTLNSNSGEILTYSSPENGRSKLGLGSAATLNVGQSGSSIPILSKSNTWSQTQTVQVSKLGQDGLVLDTLDTLPSYDLPTGSIFRAPAFVSKASNLGKGIHAKFFCEESYRDTSRAVIELSNWNNDYHWWTFSASGNAFADGSWVNSSDERLKENFKTIDTGDILSKALQLRGYTFNRVKTGEKCVGFKAQEVQKVLPEAVINIGDTVLKGEKVSDTLGLDYGAMAAFNHECILALINRLEEAEQVINSLKEKLEQDAG